LQEAIRESGLKVVLRGSKKTDERVGVPNGHVENGIEYRSPLWDWTHSRVLAYLRDEGIELPMHYRTVLDSMDCWLCTGYLGPQYHGKERLEFIREHYPDLWPHLVARLRRVRAALTEEFLDMRPALNLGDN
jgi:3'-phosphoadenosine 5'-phosphosulfate sulfotransferase (PAPS reductase)/FAD synthetase